MSDEDEDKFDIPNIIDGSVVIHHTSECRNTFKDELDTRASRMRNKAGKKNKWIKILGNKKNKRKRGTCKQKTLSWGKSKGP